MGSAFRIPDGIAEQGDVNLSSLVNGQILLYNSTTGKWENGSVPTGASGYSGYSGTSGYSGYSGYSGISGFSGQPGNVLAVLSYINNSTQSIPTTTSTAVIWQTLDANQTLNTTGVSFDGSTRFINTNAQAIVLTVTGFVGFDTGGSSGERSVFAVINGEIASNNGRQASISYPAGASAYTTGNFAFNIVLEQNDYFEIYAYHDEATSININAQASYPGSRISILRTDGVLGQSGYSGYSGISGYSGYSGISGYSGYSGISGFSGYSGLSGFSGYSGIGTSGYSGYSGISGFSGFSGYSGASGFSGYSGISGFSGYSGSGQSGYSGYSGIGSSGFSGYSGISGFSGYSGAAGSVGAVGGLFFYVFDIDASTDVAPGNSGFHCNSPGSQGAITKLWLDNEDVTGNSAYTFVNTMLNASYTSKAFCSIRGSAGSERLYLQIDAITAKTGYYELSVTTIVAPADPLDDGDLCGFNFAMVGASGFSGYSGVGASGFSGYSGVGLSGFSGYIGASGYSGYSGISGYSGYSGISGFSGYSGSGASGFSGYSGVSVSGFSGYSGASTSGFSGYSGISGFSGYSGISGFSGYSGISGFSGYSGISGFSGYSGISGFSGYSGNSGFSGYSGPSGFSGYSGISGFSGYSGSGVSGYSGYSGISGYSGYSGRAGESSSIYQYQADTNNQSGQPATGYLLWNNSTQINSTQINVFHITQDGIDIDIFLALIQTSQRFTIQDRDASANYQIWQVSNGTTNVNANTANSYWTIPVTLVSSGGTGTTNFTNNHALFLAITASTSGFSGYSGTSGYSGYSGAAGGVSPAFVIAMATAL